MDGYASPDEADVPALMTDGAFEAPVPVNDLYDRMGRGPGDYYLMVALGSHFASSTRFRLPESAPPSGPATEGATDRPSAPADAAAPPDSEGQPEPAAPSPGAARSEPGTAPADSAAEPSAAPPVPSATPQADNAPEETASPSESGEPDAVETSVTAPADVESSGGAKDRGRPTRGPVTSLDASALDASNTGSLSGTRHGDIISLLIPLDRAGRGDWVAVVILPGGRTPGWTQVADDNSVSIDVSGLGTGTYQLAVYDMNSVLLGWAQLEVTGASGAEDGAALTAPVTPIGPDAPGLQGGWMLASACGLLLVGALSLLVLLRSVRRGRARGGAGR